MINSIGSARIQHYSSPLTAHKAENNVKTIEGNNHSRQNENNNIKDNFMSFLNSATPKELESRLNTIKQSGPPMAVINLRQILSSKNPMEISERIERTSGQFNQEAKIFHKQQYSLIAEGQAVGKSPKEILTNIAGLYDKQSELFKMSVQWGSEGLSAPDNYSKLVKMTPNYFNSYA